MNRFLARLIFETWAAQYDPEATAATTRDHHVILSAVVPHIYAPMVPPALRGPKWGDTMTYPQPGDFALTRISGITGALISVGQHLVGDGAPVQHAYVYVGQGEVVQAMPGGAEYKRLEEASEPVVWSTGKIPLTAADRVRIVGAARGLVGTPYSFLDYASIALAHYRIRPRWVRDFVADSGHLICSQLVDEAYLRAGVHLFDDGRIPGDVTPGDLWRLLSAKRVTSTDRDLWRLAHG